MTPEVLYTQIDFFACLTSSFHESRKILIYSYLDIYLKQIVSQKNVKDFILTYLDLVQKYEITTGTSEFHFPENFEQELSLWEKVLFTIYCIKIYNCSGNSDAKFFNKITENLCSQLNITNNILSLIISICEESEIDIKQKENIVVIVPEGGRIISSIKTISCKNLLGYIIIYKIEGLDTYFIKNQSSSNIYLNNQLLFEKCIYSFHRGSYITSENILPIFFNDIEKKFALSNNFNDYLLVNNVSHNFKNKSKALENIDLLLESYDFVGILGNSGSGKTTLLNVLNGTTMPETGTITYNGQNIHSSVFSKSIVAYVSQDDLLNDDLTVFDNLFFAARFAFPDLTLKETKDKTRQMLTYFELNSIANLKVGTTVSKLISGGQRKRLSIALELIRNPEIIIVDEPTSGLSSNDADKIIQLLKKICLQGKIVIVSIHQPSTKIFFQFNKILVIGKGGKSIYSGKPEIALNYLKSKLRDINRTDSFSEPAEVLKLSEKAETLTEKTLNENSVEEKWYNHFSLLQKEKSLNYLNLKPTNPTKKNNIPNLLNQSTIFFLRDIKSKLANKQYIWLSISISLLIALPLSLLMRYNNNNHRYNFYENDNIPIYIFSCVIVSIFIGLLQSSNEIIKDRKTLKRESFWGLSFIAYLNSKLVQLFLISALQVLIFLVICNYILEIKEHLGYYFLVLWSLACFANAVGLFLSTFLKTDKAIYVIIPFFLIPQLILSGFVVDFKKINKIFKSDLYTPLIGDIMASRWGFEALSVNQFKNNKYQKEIFQLDKKISQKSFLNYVLLPRLKDSLSKINPMPEFGAGISGNNHTIIKFVINNLKHYSLGNSFFEISSASMARKNFNGEKYLFMLSRYLEKVHINIKLQLQQKLRQKDYYFNDTLNKNADTIKLNFYNNKLADLVLDKKSFNKSEIINGIIISKTEPVFQDPISIIGRAPMYSSYKKLGVFKIDTIWFNLWVIWAMTGIVVLNIILYYKYSKL